MDGALSYQPSKSDLVNAEWGLKNDAIQTCINPHLAHQRHRKGLRLLSIEESHHYDRSCVSMDEEEPTVAILHVS